MTYHLVELCGRHDDDRRDRRRERDYDDRCEIFASASASAQSCANCMFGLSAVDIVASFQDAHFFLPQLLQCHACMAQLPKFS